MAFDRDTRSPATGWKCGRDFPQFANSLERKIDAVVFGNLFQHHFHLGVGFVLNPVLSGFRTLSQYRVSEGPFAAFPLPDGSIATRKLYNGESGSLLVGDGLLAAGALLALGIRAVFPQVVRYRAFAREAVGRDRCFLNRKCKFLVHGVLAVFARTFPEHYNSYSTAEFFAIVGLRRPLGTR